MKAKLNGAEIEGTPEEIARLLGIKLSPELKTESNYIPESCKICSNYGKGPCFCTAPMFDPNNPYRITC